MEKRAANPFDLVKGQALVLRQSQMALAESVQPSTPWSAARQTLAKMFPVLRGTFGVDAIDEITAKLRGSLHGIYNNMGEMLREGRTLVDHHNQMQEIIDAIQADPSNASLVEDLRDMLRKRAEQSLELERDRETEQLMEMVASGTGEAEIREHLISEAERLVAIEGPTIKAVEAMLVASVKAFDGQMATYGTMLAVGTGLKALNRASNVLIEAGELNVTAFNTIAGSLSISIMAAELAVDAGELTRSLGTVNNDKLKALGLKADELVARTKADKLISGD